MAFFSCSINGRMVWAVCQNTDEIYCSYDFLTWSSLHRFNSCNITINLSNTVAEQYLITMQVFYIIKMSHSIHMLSIQIDTKISSIFNNSNLSFFASNMKQSFPLIDAVRLLDTLEYSITLVSIQRQMSREIWKYGCLAKLFITQKYERPSCQKKRKKKDSIWPLL